MTPEEFEALDAELSLMLAQYYGAASRWMQLNTIGRPDVLVEMEKRVMELLDRYEEACVEVFGLERVN